MTDRDRGRFAAVSAGGLDVPALLEAAGRPAPFEPGAEFWDDPEVAPQLLEAHLDPDREAASRTPDRIDAEVDWLVEALGLEPGDAVVDLGCGPGLYCERLADRGLRVTGIDVSRVALEHARERARESDCSIDYRREDYRELSDEAAFDAAVLVYFDLGTYGGADRNAVLSAVRRALVPGGRFAFDVRTPTFRGPADAGREWTLSREGFWRSRPHLVLTETFAYPEERAMLDQHVVVCERGTASVYRHWERQYDRAEIETVLRDRGFAVDRVAADLRGTALGPHPDTLGVVARRVEGSGAGRNRETPRRGDVGGVGDHDKP